MTVEVAALTEAASQVTRSGNGIYPFRFCPLRSDPQGKESLVTVSVCLWRRGSDDARQRLVTDLLGKGRGAGDICDADNTHVYMSCKTEAQVEPVWTNE